MKNSPNTAFIFQPIQVREQVPEKRQKIEQLSILTQNREETDELIKLATTLNYGLNVARDIGEGDPERMSPLNIEKYLNGLFKGTSVRMSLIDDEKKLIEEYPLFAAVNRAASAVERHRGRIVFLEYVPENVSGVRKTLFLVGKGVTYDTGGADIKAGGVMAGMSRDKCGAAAAAGFMSIVARLQPKNVRVVAGLSLVRNSVGEESYVADELIVSRAGVRVRVGNTDAEGRMVMTDVLCRVSTKSTDLCSLYLSDHCCIDDGSRYFMMVDYY